MGKAEEKKKKKREELLNSAFDLFTQNGIANTSIANIAEKAGVAKGTFYLYFRDKYDLRDRLIRRKTAQILGHSFEALQKEKENLPLDTLEDKLIFVGSDIIRQLSEDKRTLRFISKNLSWGLLKHDLGSVQPDSVEGQANLYDLLKAAFRESRVKYRNPELMLYLILELVGSTCYSAILYEDPVPMAELNPYLASAIRGIMRSQELPSS